ncbi:DUF262 domain-containing protein [Methylobacterium sp. J-068]|uniref:DUF262 domain-containing protein n=1 Tax=Methylobacterium sp. J-068 TaxID=2836649 RepID=UPI001FB9F291|nr:DUF262 domain-containing protein [Methylobacterium sp. J-068]MCJ2037245.1 DUF262 domain-containing protein [Methylobacterium sp. J-068]
MSLFHRGQIDLTVKGETIERIYSGFCAKKYVVNRRYQRKLVWTLDEKRNFIDSVASNFPVPIILLADPKVQGHDQVEIIDGMQRMNAVISFIENEFSWNDAYFDLNTLAITKSLLDEGALTQKTPVLERKICVQIASYQLPLSIFESAERDNIEEVFRRINSGGRKLSRQELRIAGATGDFANAVRKISTLIRSDTSDSDLVFLNNMKEISITSRDLNYGIDIESVFWVKNGILTKDQVRESRDEEIVADMMAFMVAEIPPPSRSEYLDAIFGFKDAGSSADAFVENEDNVRKYNADVLTQHFHIVLDELRLTLESGNKTLGEVLFKKKPTRAPRYFQVVFLALFDQIVRKRKRLTDRAKLLSALSGVGEKINIPEGGSWGANDRADEVKRTSATISKAFSKSDQPDPARANWISKLENILTQSLTEQAAYDFKQGFIRLDGSSKFDDESLEKVIQTSIGIANIGEKKRGYVIIGVADKKADAQRVESLYGIQPIEHRYFQITGIEHEAKALNISIDAYFRKIVSAFKNRISGNHCNYILSNMKLINYYQKVLLIIEVEGQNDPVDLDGVYYLRNGNTLSTVNSKDLMAFARNYPRVTLP